MTKIEEFEAKLKEKGYYKFKPGKFVSKHIVQGFQKKFKDEHGVKYFITIYKWEEWQHPYTAEVYPNTYEYNVQFTNNGDAVDLLFHSSWELEDVEEKVEQIWKDCWFDYYEMFGTEDRRVTRKPPEFDPHKTPVGARIDWMNGNDEDSGKD